LGFLGGNDSLLSGAIGQADAALEALGDGVGRFEGNREREVSRKRHLLANRKRCVSASMTISHTMVR
jgi:hypothetical protein